MIKIAHFSYFLKLLNVVLDIVGYITLRESFMYISEFWNFYDVSSALRTWIMTTINIFMLISRVEFGIFTLLNIAKNYLSIIKLYETWKGFSNLKCYRPTLRGQKFKISHNMGMLYIKMTALKWWFKSKKLFWKMLLLVRIRSPYVPKQLI